MYGILLYCELRFSAQNKTNKRMLHFLFYFFFMEPTEVLTFENVLHSFIVVPSSFKFK